MRPSGGAGDNPPEYRPYSPVSQPGTDTLALAVKRYPAGVCSTWMHERAVGDTIPITSPSGNLGVRDLGRDVPFLATGTGLTPMVAMATQYLREGSGRATLVFGERTQKALMLWETFDLYAANHSAFAVEYVLSDEDWSGPTGFVQDHLPDLIDDAAGTDFYVCGVPEMVVDTTAMLRDLGAFEDHIFVEGWEEGAVEEEKRDSWSVKREQRNPSQSRFTRHVPPRFFSVEGTLLPVSTRPKH